jgi:hypothetical protein
MTNNPKLHTLTVAFCLTAMLSMAQAPAEPAKQASATQQDDEFAKKKTETKLMEVVPTDSLPAIELVKRAEAWVKGESPKYKKSSVTTSGGKVECEASFPVKPKELNPEVDYSGKISMKVIIECKDSRYRYTVSDIKHISKSGNTNGGSIDNQVPECGSMAMTDIVWKKLKGEALKGASQVVTDLKAGMSVEPTQEKPDEW